MLYGRKINTTKEKQYHTGAPLSNIIVLPRDKTEAQKIKNNIKNIVLHVTQKAKRGAVVDKIVSVKA